MVMYKNLTKEEFCTAVKMSPENWVFRESTPDAGFWLYNGEYYYDNGVNKTRKYKDMPLYHEIWMSVREYDKNGHSDGWSLYGTWKQY